MSLLFRSVDELAALVRDGEVSSRELVQESLDRIQTLNPQVNAFVDVFGDEALAAAGAIIVGTTTLPEYGIQPVTETRRFGPTRNPWDTDRTPGGSSGGSAAAVAAGLVPLGHANDGGGSTRIPPPCCGLVGLKPP